MIWQMEEWRLEAEEHFDFSLLLSKNPKDSSKKGALLNFYDV